MVRRFFLLSLALGVLLLPTVASANSLVFSFGNPTGHTGVGLLRFVTGNGVGMLTNQIPSLKQKVSPAILTSVANVGAGGTSISNASSNIGTFSFTTGHQIGLPTPFGGGSLYTYSGGSSTNLSILASATGFCNVKGCVAPNSVLFSGYFNGPIKFLIITPIPGKPNIKTGSLTAKVITNTNGLSPALLFMLGLPFQSHGTAVALYIDVSLGLGGAIKAGTITLVPEPGTLVLFGSGLVTLAGLLRKRLQ